MSTTSAKSALETLSRLSVAPPPAWAQGTQTHTLDQSENSVDAVVQRPSAAQAFQALLAFSALHQQIRQRRSLSSNRNGIDVVRNFSEFETSEHFVLDEVLQMVAERAISITGADGLGIALAENNEIVLRASAGTIKPDIGARIQRDSAFSGACFRTAQVIRCDDAEKDSRVNLAACRELGARSMVAVPLCGRRRVIGLLEAFSAEPFGFNDSDVNSLELLAELVVSALKPEEEDRFAESACAAEQELIAPATTVPEKVALATVRLPPAPISAVLALKPSTLSESLPSVAEKILEPPLALPSTLAADAAAASAVAEPSQAKAVAEKKAVVPTHDDDILEVSGANASMRSPAEVGLDELLEPETASELTGETSPKSYLVMIVIIVLLIMLAIAGAFWWKMKNAEMAQALISKRVAQPTQQIVDHPETKALGEPIAVPAQATGDQSGANTKPSSPPNSSSSDFAGEPGTSQSPAESGKAARVTGIRHWSSADSSTVVLDLQDQVQYEAHRLANPDRIYFDLHDTSLATQVAGGTIEIGDALLARVRVAQPVAGSIRVVLETKSNPNYSVSLEPNPYRLVVQLRKAGASPTSQINLFPGSDDAARKQTAIVVPPPTHEDLQLKAHVSRMKIVVDAGHGGWDLGTVGKRGLLEKDVVLEIAQRLGKLLESRLGAEVILTRNDDTYVPLDERASVANSAQADLFVSVHANYSDLPSARGVETYFTNFFSSPNAKEVELRQDGSAGKNAASAALTPVDLHDRIEQSRKLAASVQRSLYGALSVQNPGLRDRGVKEASYVVLTETSMPGILAEVSFVSSPADEQRLRTDGYREQIAEALYKGIAHYAAAAHPVKMASAR